MSPAQNHERPTGRRAAPREPAVSVVVPVYNGAALIEGCVRALDTQTLDPARYEVIVVDDGSTDDTVARIRAWAHDSRAAVTVIEHAQNRGPAAARNAGIAAARAPVIAFTDADCEPAPDWLARALERLDAEPAIAAVEGRTEPKGEPGPLTHQMINRTGGLWMTCNMIYRRAAIESVGGFDERFRLAFLEDSDVAFAVQETVGPIAWDPGVVVWHLVLPASRAKFAREARKRFYNPLLYAKHPAFYVRHLKPVVPGLPRMHVRYMISVLALLGFVVASLCTSPGVWGGAVFASFFVAFYFRRVAHAYRARDLRTLVQVAVHPFVQTFWVLRGAVRFRAFSVHL